MSEDDYITLQQACETVLTGTVKPATLRAEAGRGRLVLYRVGRRDLTTVRDVREMVRRCRVQREARTFTSTQSDEHGPSEMDRSQSALAAIKAGAEKLKALSRNTSVVPIGRSRAATR